LLNQLISLKKVAYIVLIFAVSLNFGCAIQQYAPQKSVFSFNFEQTRYEIVSLNTSSGEGTNLISELTESDIKNVARDINQDGTIDIVIKGSLSIEEFDVIYKAGIESARKTGNYQERISLRRFEWTFEQFELRVTTYFVSEDDVNNVFFILSNTDRTEHLFTDRFADGKLDNTDKGSINFVRAQQLYEMTLIMGLAEKRISFDDIKYIVLEKPIPISQRSYNDFSPKK